MGCGRLELVAAANRRRWPPAVAGVGTVVVFDGMVFNSIATHIANTFGEYPYLTLNAYNPWALVADAITRWTGT